MGRSRPDADGESSLIDLEAEGRAADGKLKEEKYQWEKPGTEKAMSRSFEVYRAREQEAALGQRQKDFASARALTESTLKERELKERALRSAPSQKEGALFIPWIMAAVNKALMH